MSGKLMAWALEQDIGPAPKIVLVAICDLINDQPGHEYFWGSQEWLAEKIHSNERSVRGHLKTLEDNGWIRREKRKIQGRATTDAIYVCVQRQEVADGKKPSSPAASFGSDQRQEVADNTLKDSLKENLTPSFDDLEEEWKKLGLTPKTESFAKAVKVWHMLTDEEKQQAIAGCKPFQQQYRRENRNDIKMLGLFRYLDEKRFKDFCEQSKLPEGTMFVRRGEEGWDEWVEHKVAESGNPMGRRLYLPGGQFADMPMLVTSQYPPGTDVSRETASPETWRSRVVRFRENGEWSSNWGPKPGEAGCLAPDEPRRQSA